VSTSRSSSRPLRIMSSTVSGDERTRQHVLLDNRALVQVRSHVMGCGTDDFHPALLGLLVGSRALRRPGRNEWWMLMMRPWPALHECRATESACSVRSTTRSMRSRPAAPVAGASAAAFWSRSTGITVSGTSKCVHTSDRVSWFETILTISPPKSPNCWQSIKSYKQCEDLPDHHSDPRPRV